MSVGFGFSVGDFVAAIELVGTVIDSLREAGSSSAQYRELIGELYTLETALLRVKRLDVEDVQSSELVSLQQAAAQCQRTIDNFWQKIAKYQRHLRVGGSGSRLKDSWMRVKWARCKKEDVEQFKASLTGHTVSINLLLTTVLVNATTLHGQRQKTLARRIRDSFHQAMGTLDTLTSTVAVSLRQGKQLLQMTATVVRTNIQVFQMLCAIQKQISNVPGQVDCSKTVYMIDALNKPAPFQLEFVRSAEALRSVLKANFSGLDHASEKIDRGEFILQESATQRIIDLEQDWDRCFRPGQRVTMSMIFHNSDNKKSTCPNCRTMHDESTKGDVQCIECGLIYQDIYNMSELGLPYTTYTTLLSLFLKGRSEPANDPSFGPKRLRRTLTRIHTENLDEMRQYGRVNIVASRPNHLDFDFKETESNIKKFMVSRLLLILFSS